MPVPGIRHCGDGTERNSYGAGTEVIYCRIWNGGGMDTGREAL